MLRPGIVIGVAAAVLASAVGCGGSDGVEVFRNETVPVELTVSMKGDVNVEFRNTVPSRFVVRRSKSKNEDVYRSQVVGTETVGPVQQGGGAFIAGVAVLPFTGDGEYTIPVGSPLDHVREAANGNQDMTVTSSVKVEWWPNGDTEADPELYMRRARPCRVVIKKNGARGSLQCPDVTDEDQKKHFTLTLSWAAPERPSSSTPSSSTGDSS